MDKNLKSIYWWSKAYCLKDSKTITTKKMYHSLTRKDNISKYIESNYAKRINVYNIKKASW